MKEYEKKIMLTEDEYFAIVMWISKYVLKESQTNYYFDNDDLSMNKRGITCRIREKGGKYKTTVKNHGCERPDCSIEVDLVEKPEFDTQIFNAFGLHLRGKLVTHRIVLYKDSSYNMVLDRNVYLGYTDFELEVEYCEENQHKAQTFLENIARCLVATKHLSSVDEFLSRIGQGGSKSERFFERLQKN